MIDSRHPAFRNRTPRRFPSHVIGNFGDDLPPSLDASHHDDEVPASLAATTLPAHQSGKHVGSRVRHYFSQVFIVPPWSAAWWLAGRQ